MPRIRYTITFQRSDSRGGTVEFQRVMRGAVPRVGDHVAYSWETTPARVTGVTYSAVPDDDAVADVEAYVRRFEGDEETALKRLKEWETL